MLFKLKQNGVSGGLLKLFENYLHNRKQRVVLNGTYSDYSIIETGVTQGSVLGRLLFSPLANIYTKSRHLTSTIRNLVTDL